MDAQRVKSSYLNFVNDQLEVQPYEGGHLVWLPMHRSDDDAICLAVRPDSNGWLVTDDGTTMARLQTLGASVEGPRFREAWADLARPNTGYIPTDGHDYEIAAWGSEDEVGSLLAVVGEAAIRAEGLAHLAEAQSKGPTFSRKVTQSVRHAVSARAGLTVTPRGKVAMRSGGSRPVTATVTRGNETVLAVQALGGKDRDGRLRSHDVAYGIFGPSELPRERRLAVAVGHRQMWDRHLLQDIDDIAVLTFLDSAVNFTHDVNRMVDAVTA